MTDKQTHYDRVLALVTPILLTDGWEQLDVAGGEFFLHRPLRSPMVIKVWPSLTITASVDLDHPSVRRVIEAMWAAIDAEGEDGVSDIEDVAAIAAIINHDMDRKLHSPRTMAQEIVAAGFRRRLIPDRYVAIPRDCLQVLMTPDDFSSESYVTAFGVAAKVIADDEGADE